MKVHMKKLAFGGAFLLIAIGLLGRPVAGPHGGAAQAAAAVATPSTAALSLIVSVPLRVPVAFGVNVTEMEQKDPAKRLVEQLFVCEKSPVNPIVVMLILLSPLLVRVMF